MAVGWLLLAWWWWSIHRSRPTENPRRFAAQLQALARPARRRQSSNGAAHRARRQQRMTQGLLGLVVVSGVVGLVAQSALLVGILVTVALALLGAYRIAVRRVKVAASKRQSAIASRQWSDVRSGPPR